MKLRWTRRALADLDRIAARIAMDKPTAAVEFVTTISDKVGHLQEFPLMGRAGVYQTPQPQRPSACGSTMAMPPAADA